MGVDDRIDVGTVIVDSHVHGHFGGALARAGDLVAGVVADDQILGTHAALADAGGSGEDAFAVQAHGQVAVIGRDPTAFVHHPARRDDVFAELLLAGGHKPL